MTDPRPRQYDGHDLEALNDLPRYRAWILSFFSPFLRGRALEYGAGIGTLSALLQSHVDQLDIVEPAENLLPVLKSRFATNPRVAVCAATIEQHAKNTKPASVDCVVMVNVLEHIEDDRGVLGNLFGIVKPGGHLLLFVPALNWLMSPMDGTLGHYRRYYRKGLVRLLTDVGFELVTARYFDSLGMLPWWLFYTLGGKTRFNSALAKFYDRFFVPPLKAIETIVPPPFGKNLVVVARRPTA